MASIEAVSMPGLEEPFPGLRHFETSEALKFFGREAHTAELLTRLGVQRFIAVVGNSGSGKSSLVRAGLLPALCRGYLAGATSRWKVAVMKPGNHPIRSLAESLNQPAALGASGSDQRLETLESSSLGLVDVIREHANLAPGESFLIVADQFEEIFRFGGGDDAGLFVSQLLQAAAQYEVPIYVILTMRSEFIGNCARFPGLPEALNRSQYLVPRLTRQQRQLAIEGPLHVCGISVTPRLVQRLLNDDAEEVDDLPVLQHVLMRAFRKWKASGSQGPLDLEHYHAAGGTSAALDQHAREILATLPPESRPWTERIFRALTTIQGTREIRRPHELGELYTNNGAGADHERNLIDAVVLRFLRPEHSLLLASTEQGLHPSTVIDISHESLIRKWQDLRAWVKEEARSAEWYCDLTRDIARGGNTWRDPDLARAEEHLTRDRWNPAWAAQYCKEGPCFDDVKQFLVRSRDEQKSEEEHEREHALRELQAARSLAASERRTKKWAGATAVLTLVLLIGVIAFAGYRARQRAALDAANAAYQQSLVRTAETTLATQTTEASLAVQQRELATASDDAERIAIQNRIDRLNKEYEQQLAVSKEAERKLNAQRQSLSKEQQQKQSQFAQTIESLQTELARSRAENKSLNEALSAANTQGREAARWKQESADLRARVDTLQQQLYAAQSQMNVAGSTGAPVFKVLPQASFVPISEQPFNGNAGLLIGDLKRGTASTVQIVLLHTGAVKEMPAAFTDQEGKAERMIAEYSSTGCSPQGTRQRSGAICFTATRREVLEATQRLGTFRTGSYTFQIAVVGWNQRTLGGPDTLVVALYRVQ